MSSDLSLSPTAANCGMVADKALEVYRACKSCVDEDYQTMAGDVANLHVVLTDIRDDLLDDTTGLTHTRADDLKKHLNIAHAAVNILEGLVQTYEKMRFASQTKYSRLHVALDYAGEAHSQITSSTDNLRVIEKKIVLNSQSRLDRLISKYLREIAEGSHEGSVLNLVPGDEIDKRRNWERFRRELEELGISRAEAMENREFLEAVISRAREDGMLDPANDMEIPAEDSEVASTMEEVDKSFDKRVAAKQTLSLEELRKRREQHVESKKFSPLVAACLRAVRIVSDERLIEAADEGNLDKVRYLIKGRVNVNTSDKWRWTALHMAAYGGFDKIAQELIKAGAEIDARTVDGETPLILAIRNRHVEVMHIITDRVEELRRAQRSNETDITVEDTKAEEN